MSRSRGRARLHRLLRRWVKLGMTLVTETIVVIVLITSVVAASHFRKRAETEKTNHGLWDIFNAPRIVCLSLSLTLAHTFWRMHKRTHTHIHPHFLSVCLSLRNCERNLFGEKVKRQQIARVQAKCLLFVRYVWERLLYESASASVSASMSEFNTHEWEFTTMILCLAEGGRARSKTARGAHEKFQMYERFRQLQKVCVWAKALRQPGRILFSCRTENSTKAPS